MYIPTYSKYLQIYSQTFSDHRRKGWHIHILSPWGWLLEGLLWGSPTWPKVCLFCRHSWPIDLKKHLSTLAQRPFYTRNLSHDHGWAFAIIYYYYCYYYLLLLSLLLYMLIIVMPQLCSEHVCILFEHHPKEPEVKLIALSFFVLIQRGIHRSMRKMYHGFKVYLVSTGCSMLRF